MDAKTDIPDEFPELWNIVTDVVTGGYLRPYLGHEIDIDTNSYTSVTSGTAHQEFAQDLVILFRNLPDIKPDWLKYCEPQIETVDSDSRIDEGVLAIARLEQRPSLFVHDLGWSSQEAMETRSRLATFEDDWNAPGMELYDEL